MVDLDKIQQAAEAATPGPWIAAGPSFGGPEPKWFNEVVVDDGTDGPLTVCLAPHSEDMGGEGDATMDHIANCDPQTALKLIAVVRAAKDMQERGKPLTVTLAAALGDMS